MESERMLVAGCGYLGRALATQLAAAGHSVWGVRRTAEALPGVEMLAADLTAPGLAAALPPDLGVVFYTVAAGGRGEAAYRSAYVDGLANLLSALAASGSTPRRVLFTSSTVVYAQDDGSWVDEASPTDPAPYRGRIQLEAESLLEGGVRLRLGGLYGPGRNRLLDRVRAGEARVADGPRYTNRIHRDDAVAALIHLAELPEAAPVYLGVDDEPAERAEVLGWLARRLAAPPVPDGPAPGRQGKRCRNARLRATGWEPRYPSYREGYAQVLSEAGA